EISCKGNLPAVTFDGQIWQAFLAIPLERAEILIPPESGLRDPGPDATPAPGIDEAAPVLLRSARPALTAQMMAQSGLDDEILRRLVHNFYAKIRTDPLLGPIFEARVRDWPAHLERMCAFWSSVALSTGRYSGAPMPAHMPLPVDWPHFQHWLA